MCTPSERETQAVEKIWKESFTRLNRGQPGITGLMAFSQAWRVATDFLRPRDLADSNLKRSESDVNNILSALEMVIRCQKQQILLETFFEDIRKHFYLIAGDLSRFIQEYEKSEDPNVISALVLRLVEWYRAWAPPPQLGENAFSAYTLTFQTQLFCSLPPTFSRGFRTLCASTLPPLANEEQQTTQVIHKSSRNIWSAFETLGFLGRYESIVASVGYQHIESHVIQTCTAKWDSPMLEELRGWMSNRMVPWMLLPFARGAETTEQARAMLQGVGSRFDFHMNKTLCDLRTKEIFDIIIDFPDSVGALQDLRDCLQRVDQRAALVQSLRGANTKRLLHPGADTKLILAQYVATIKCLRIVDPPGVLLFKVADPIRRYLRERPDTIRSIVANLVGDDEGGDSLLDENEPVRPLQQLDLEDYSDPNWEPEPIDAGPDFRVNKPSDILSTLVSIYDSKDLFVKELQVLLAQRLLSIHDNDEERIEKERRNVEILKIRFGESALQVCEVMLKDVTDSKRTDYHVQSQKANVVHPTIVSHHFWPALESSDIIMPGQLRKLQEEYSEEFSVFKPDKKLFWLSQLGMVHLTLQLEDRTIDADVAPLEAAFVELFCEKDVWTAENLIKGVGTVSTSAALNALRTWVDLEVLKEEDGVFTLLEVADESSNDLASHSKLARPIARDICLASEERHAEQMRVYWKYIEGMLNNLGTLPLDRIQTMLKYVPGYDKTQEQLAGFLEAVRREGLVILYDGMWKLVS